MSNIQLLIMGCGGHARSVADVAVSCGFQDFIFVDANAKLDEYSCGFKVLSSVEGSFWSCLLGSGDNTYREQQWQEATERKWTIRTLISPHASRGIGSILGEGTVVLHHVHIGPMSELGKGCIINTGAIIEHDCKIGDFSHVSINAALAGNVVLGSHTMIGAGAVIKNNVHIGDNVMIGAGATVVNHIEEPGVYVGTPARLLKS